MTKTIRIIPRLDIKGPNLVKGIHMEGLRVMGKPWDFALKYYEEGADELIFIDAVASLYGRNNLADIVRKTAENIFIPLTVGGGIRSVDDIRSLLRAGADKVAINTEAVKNIQIIKDASKTFGSQCIVASIQAKKIGDRYFAYTDNARESTTLDVFEWAERLAEAGAGELIVTSIDQEGTGKGYDISLTRKLSTSLNIPVIACGGCGSKEHFLEAIIEGKADAICASSIFHYNYLQREASEEKYLEEGNIEFLKKIREGTSFMKGRLNPVNIIEAKNYLILNRISCRIV